MTRSPWLTNERKRWAKEDSRQKIEGEPTQRFCNDIFAMSSAMHYLFTYFLCTYKIRWHFLKCLRCQADVRMAERSKAPDSRVRYLPIVQWGWAFWSPNGGVGSNPTPDNFFLSCHHLTSLAWASHCEKSPTSLHVSFRKRIITVISRGSITCSLSVDKSPCSDKFYPMNQKNVALNGFIR